MEGRPSRLRGRLLCLGGAQGAGVGRSTAPSPSAAVVLPQGVRRFGLAPHGQWPPDHASFSEGCHLCTGGWTGIAPTPLPHIPPRPPGAASVGLVTPQAPGDILSKSSAPQPAVTSEGLGHSRCVSRSASCLGDGHAPPRLGAQLPRVSHLRTGTLAALLQGGVRAKGRIGGRGGANVASRGSHGNILVDIPLLNVSWTRPGTCVAALHLPGPQG